MLPDFCKHYKRTKLMYVQKNYILKNPGDLNTTLLLVYFFKKEVKRLF